MIVDDGSTDSTLAAAQDIAAADERVRVLSQPNAGPSSARNRGIEAARSDWLLFLDADDELTPGGLGHLAAATGTHGATAWWHGGWRRVVGSGRGVEYPAEPMPDPRGRIAVGCPFAIHACLVRTDAVRAVGGFDESLQTCEDWDLWRKLAAAGHIPRPVDVIVASYVVRATSASSSLRRLLTDGFTVIDRAFPDDHPGTADRASARAAFAAYLASIEVGRGADATWILNELEPGSAPDAGPTLVASFLVTGLPIGAVVPIESWPQTSRQLQQALRDFLGRLEQHVGARHLAARIERRLELEIAKVASPLSAPAQVLGGLLVDLDLALAEQAGPAPAITLPQGVDRIHVRALITGEIVATGEIAAFGSAISGADLVDGLLDTAAWPTLEAAVLRPLLPTLSVEPSTTGTALIRRGDVALGEVATTEPSERELLDAVGWPLFVQELFGLQASDPAAVYDRRARLSSRRARSSSGAVTVELTDLPTVWTPSRQLHIDVRLGGRPFDAFALAPRLGRVTAARMREQIVLRNGASLARGLLTARLTPPSTVVDAEPPTLGHDLSRGPIPSRLQQRTFAGEGAAAIAAAGRVYGRPQLAVAPDGQLTIGPGAPRTEQARAMEARPATTQVGRRSAASFDALFANDDDPWAYTSGYEQTKYEQTLRLLPARVDRALELACAEGHFTVQMAPLATELLATDVSPLALERAGKRCAHQSNVRFERHDLFADPVPGSWPLIICSEVLYFAGDKQALRRVVDSIVAALEIDGLLVHAHANLVVDDPTSPGFDWDEHYGSLGIQQALLATGLVVLEHEIITPMYRVQRYRRTNDPRAAAPTITEQAEPSADLLPDIAARFLPTGGYPAKAAAPARVPLSVPILMYHRVAPDGADGMRRWRVTPDELAAQLDFLLGAGYTAITPQQWRDAAILGADLPDQPVLLTFDDGYQDFADHAYPLLAARNMTATVLLVDGFVGAGNAWNTEREPVPLMGWDAIRELHAAGIAFGAHTSTHPPLTAITSAEALREISGSIVAIHRELGVPPAAFAYPYGDVTPAVRGLAGACGVDLAFSCIPGIASAQDDLLMLPRIEVRGDRPIGALIGELAPW